MDILKAAVISICFTAIAVGIIESLLPNNSFRPQLRLLTGAVLMISLISPFFALMNMDMPDVSKIYDLSNGVNINTADTMQSAAAVSAKTEIGAILKQYGIDEAVIKIFTTENEDSSIQISKAEIFVDKKDLSAANEAVIAIKSQLGVDTYAEEKTG